MGTLRILRKLVGFSFSTAVYETIARNKLVVFLLMESEKGLLSKIFSHRITFCFLGAVAFLLTVFGVI